MNRLGLLGVLSLALAGTAQSPVAGVAVKPDAAGVLVLEAATARLLGPDLRLETKGTRRNIGYWQQANSSMEWTADFPRPGTYRATLEYSLANGNRDNEIEIWVGPALLAATPRPTTTWEMPARLELGGVDVEKAGVQTVRIKASRKVSQYILNVYELRLHPPGVSQRATQ